MGDSEDVAQAGNPAASITLSSPAVFTQPANQYGEAPQNGYFVTVHASVTADASFANGFSINPDDFYALVNGVHYGWDSGHAMFALPNATSELSYTTLAAGESVNGPIAFDVSAAHGEIVYAPNLSAQPLAQWKF